MDFFNHFFSFDSAFEYLQWESLVYIVEAFVLLWIGKFVRGILAPSYNLNQELTHHDNKALAVAFVGYMMGIGIVILGVLSSGGAESGYVGNPLIDNMIGLAIWSLIGIVLLNVARMVNEKLILHDFDNTKEIITDRNVGVGAVHFGSYFGSALILFSVIAGDSSGSFGADIIATIVYFVISQLAFVLFSKVYQRISKFDLHKEIEDNDNAAAGVSYGLTLAAIGVILSNSVASSGSLASFAILFLNGAVLLVIARVLLDKIIIPGGAHLDEEISRDHNWGLALLEGGLALTVAFLIKATF